MIKIRKHYQNLTDENIDRLIKIWENNIHDLRKIIPISKDTLSAINSHNNRLLELRTLKHRNN